MNQEEQQIQNAVDRIEDVIADLADGAQPAGWVLVAHAATAEQAWQGTGTYMYLDSKLPEHAARGLLDMGMDYATTRGETE